MLTVHMIGNAHIDPVWLWRWPAGIGEALATCRTACDLLDEFPEMVFTRSDVWVHERVEELDPPLFERIRRHAASGRWAVTGGWYVQPDCNFPREESFQKHIDIGRKYFREKLGLRVTVGYNVDSFGHAGSLPRILADNGYDSYVMMRPMAHEKTLPADLFRWQSTEEAGGMREVITWRIPVAYCTSAKDLSEHVGKSIGSAVHGVDHVMCFYGVGDHGGGPTREQVRWILANRNSFPGARLVFSHPRAFFDAVKPSAGKLPIVRGELQMHAVGCYSVARSLKRAMRAAEHGLLMAEQTLEAFPDAAPPDAAPVLRGAWKKTLFNQFHDIYGGTSIAAACEDAEGQLAGARADAESVAYAALFRHAASLPSAADQRILAFNASEVPFEGFVQWEPWLGGKRFDGWLSDQEGSPVPVQVLPSSSVAGMPGFLLWPATFRPRELRSFSLRAGALPRMIDTDLYAGTESIGNAHWEIRPGTGSGAGTDIVSLIQKDVDRQVVGPAGLTVRVFDDTSDTWSHGIDRYPGRALGDFSTYAASVEESGPVRASLRVDARFEASSLFMWVRLYRNDPRVEIEARVDWRERMRIAKLILPCGAQVLERLDGIPGGAAVRPQDGKEYPLLDWSVARLPGGTTLGVATPDCSALDGQAESLRFTLLRSPAYAWHDPALLSGDRIHLFTDQGEHTFRFTLLPGADARAANRLAIAAHRPPLCIDWTRGMEMRGARS